MKKLITSVINIQNRKSKFKTMTTTRQNLLKHGYDLMYLMMRSFQPLKDLILRERLKFNVRKGLI